MNTLIRFLSALRGGFALLVLPVCLLGVDAPEPSKDAPGGISFIPNAFRRDPTMNLTVFTELTDYGRTLPEVSTDRPAYFISHSKGFQPMGKTVGGEPPPSLEEFQAKLHQSLAARGFLPGTDATPAPTIALIFYWGSHAAMDNDDPLAEDFPELVMQHVIERAALVGGRQYAREIADRYAFGTDPNQRTPERDRLVYQSIGDLYYAVVSAYKLEDLARDERKLLWRTTMTVNAYGLAMRETLGPLVAIASDHFGRSTEQPVALRRRVSEGTISIGPLEVIETDAVTPPPDPGR